MADDLLTRKLAHLFRRFDVDGNGNVEHADFQKISAWIAGRLNHRMGSDVHHRVQAAYDLMWNQLNGLDANSDGCISPEEWQQGWRQMASGSQFDAIIGSAANTLFDCVDTDGNGTICATEFANWLCAHGVDEAAAKAAFTHLDHNGDGTMSKDETYANVRDYFTSTNPQAAGNWLFGAGY